MINGLDLFSGIGGMSLALWPWVRTIAYCENDRYAQSILLSRMRSGTLMEAPIWDDVRTLTNEIITDIDIIMAGFPCQDISQAGTGKALEGKRSALVFEVFRLVDELLPQFVFLENVPRITIRGLDRITGELTQRGYDCRWTMLRASDLGAPHQRRRWFLLANNAKGRRWKAIDKIPTKQTYARRIDQWENEPGMDRMADGIPYRLDRNRSLGNSVVPQQARTAFKGLIGVDDGSFT